MRHGVLVLLAVALTLAGVALALRQDPTRPVQPAPVGPVSGNAPAGALPTTVVPAPPGPTVVTPQADPAALARAREVLAAIEARGGAPLAGYVGGRAFNNRERRLPAGRYREYDVHPRVAGRDRGPERLVVEQITGRAYYTGDHYRTFVPLN
jgi:ribonuclease T1